MKTFQQFCIEADYQDQAARDRLIAKGAKHREINLGASWGNPGYQAPGYSYGGNTAPCRDDPTKDCPSQKRHAQDLSAAARRSRERQKEMKANNVR